MPENNFARFAGAAILLLCTCVSTLRAQPDIEFNQIEDCLANTRECLQYTESALVETPEYSLNWFKLKQFRLRALFVLQHKEQLMAELEPLVDLQRAPPVFMATVYSYYAKLLLVSEQTEKGRLYTDKAVELLKASNEVFVQPDRYAEVLNLYTYTGQLREAIAFGQWANKRISHIQNHLALTEFNTSMGHTHFKLGEYEDSIPYYQLALDGHLNTNNSQQHSVGYHNLARAYQKLGKFQQAFNHYEKSLSSHRIQGENYDAVGRQFTQIRYAEALAEGQLHFEAAVQLNSIDVDSLPDYLQKVYHEVADKVTANQ